MGLFPDLSHRAFCLHSALVYTVSRAPSSSPPVGRLLPAFSPRRRKLTRSRRAGFQPSPRYRWVPTGLAGSHPPGTAVSTSDPQAATPAGARSVYPVAAGLPAAKRAPGMQRSPRRLGQGGTRSWLGGVAVTSRQRVWGPRRSLFRVSFARSAAQKCWFYEIEV